MRAALGIEHEIKQFEKRLNSLAANIQEEQEKRQAALLGVISIISSISAIEPILETTEQVREYIRLDSALFYVLLSFVVFAIAIPILSYLFPHYAKKIWKKLSSYFKND
jgi:predicted PurR-regulated permease PerM